MPIFFQHDIDEGTKLGIWKIEEGADFFLKKVVPQRDVTHPHKKLQHLAGRFLLQYLFPEFPLELIRIADTRKPFLEDEAFHFSISHCGDYAAAIVSRENRVGVDVEQVTPKIARVRHKFTSVEEENVCGRVGLLEGEADKASTLVWSCKEAVFKWYGLGGVDFKEHMEVKTVAAGEWVETVMIFKKREEVFLNLRSRFFGEVVLSWVVS